MPLYFAYGSNLLERRLRVPERAPAAELVGAASANGYELRFHKRGADGSGKCDLVATGSPVRAAWGAVWRLSEGELMRMDRSEGMGYRRATIGAELDGEWVHATTYVAVQGAVDPTLVAFDWYRAIVVAGACEVGLPQAWIEHLEAHPTQQDPDGERRARFLALLP